MRLLRVNNLKLDLTFLILKDIKHFATCLMQEINEFNNNIIDSFFNKKMEIH
ncbi:hypothetical protein JCM15415_04600 [Methanobacterium movens]